MCSGTVRIGRHLTGQHAAFELLVAALVLTPAAAPARVVGRRRARRWLSGGAHAGIQCRTDTLALPTGATGEPGPGSVRATAESPAHHSARRLDTPRSGKRSGSRTRRRKHFVGSILRSGRAGGNGHIARMGDIRSPGLRRPAQLVATSCAERWAADPDRATRAVADADPATVGVDDALGDGESESGRAGADVAGLVARVNASNATVAAVVGETRALVGHREAGTAGVGFWPTVTTTSPPPARAGSRSRSGSAGPAPSWAGSPSTSEPVGGVESQADVARRPPTAASTRPPRRPVRRGRAGIGRSSSVPLASRVWRLEVVDQLGECLRPGAPSPSGMRRGPRRRRHGSPRPRPEGRRVGCGGRARSTTASMPAPSRRRRGGAIMRSNSRAASPSSSLRGRQSGR